jgi:hypothetical protein
VIIVLSVSIMGLLWRTPPGFEHHLKMADPSLRALKLPYRSIVVAYYLDGGSVGVRITDAVGVSREFALPVSDGEANRYKDVFVGSMHLDTKDPAGVRLSKTKESKRALIDIIEMGPHDVNRMLALLYLRGGSRDYIRWFCYCVRIRIISERASPN